MFDRFTDRARKVMNLAKSEAQRLNHEYIGTEHILLGLVQEGSGVAPIAPARAASRSTGQLAFPTTGSRTAAPRSPGET